MASFVIKTLHPALCAATGASPDRDRRQDSTANGDNKEVRNPAAMVKACVTDGTSVIAGDRITCDICGTVLFPAKRQGQSILTAN